MSHLKLQCNIPGVSEDRDDHQRTTDLILKTLDSIRASYGSKGTRYMDVLESAGTAYLAGCFDDALSLNANVVALLTNPWRDLQTEQQPEHSLFQGTMVVCQLLGENEWKVNVLWEPSAPLASWDAKMRHLSEGLSGRRTVAAVLINATNQEPSVAPQPLTDQDEADAETSVTPIKVTLKELQQLDPDSVELKRKLLWIREKFWHAPTTRLVPLL